MADKTPMSETEFDALFDAARAQDRVPSGDLVARILADADSVAAVAEAKAVVTKPGTRPGWLAGLVAAIGGWPAVAGLATAAVTGVAIGVASPDTIDSWTGGTVTAALGYEVNDLIPSVGDLLEEG